MPPKHQECSHGLSKLNTFLSDESGAVTVDWVVLTAAIVGLGLAVMSVVSGGVEDLSGDISTALTNTDPLSDPFDNANQQAADGIQ
jgi:Flp pilus assembly pilin Flp